MRHNRFQPLDASQLTHSTTRTLHRLRTAFASPSPSPTRHRRPHSTSTTSPLSPPRSPSSQSAASSGSADFSPISLFSNTSDSSTFSHASSIARLRQMIMVRHRPSVLDLSLEEEKRMFGGLQASVLEPRPKSPADVFGCGEVRCGIFEVLEGRA